jgi:SAM-dependent methyltransferase
MINWNIRHELEDFMQNVHNKKILDFGCGDARYKEIIGKNNSYVGIDVAESGHLSEDKNFNILWDKKKLPFNMDSFDIIVCTEVLEHVENIDITINELKRVLKKNGLLFVTMPFIWVEHEKPYDFRRFTSFGIKKFFSDNDFELVKYKKLVNGKLAYYQLLLSELDRTLRDDNKFKLGTSFKNLYYLIITLLFKVLIKFFLPKSTFKEMYINNCIIIKKK